MKKFVSILLALVLTGTIAHAENKVNVTFLHINDVYEISPNRDGIGGFAQVASLIKEERSNHPNSFVTFGGDLLSPSLLSGITEGKHMIEFMNAIGTDLAVPGNHEFDFGPDVFTARLGESKFPWLASNMTGSEAVIKNKIIEVEGYKIGFFGLITPETPELSSPGDYMKFGDLVTNAKSQVALLQEQGADVIVALTHNSFAEDQSLMGIKGINLILGGHDHDPTTIYDGRTLLHKSGEDAHYLGVITLEVETKEGRKGPYVDVTPSWNMRLVKDVPKNAPVEKMVADYEAMLDTELGQKVATVAAVLDSRKAVIRTEETSMGNFIADALRSGTFADIALTNGGGIRGNREYEAGHELTRKDILTELPFGNVTVLLEMTGYDVKEVLENGVSKVEEKAGRFLQISGISFTYDPKAAAGSRIVDILMDGKPLNLSATYKVATNDYIANGGDGFAMLKDATRLIDASGATLMATMVMNYASTNETLDIMIEDRITTK